MRAHVLLNLLNELCEENAMLAKQFYHFFATS